MSKFKPKYPWSIRTSIKKSFERNLEKCGSTTKNWWGGRKISYGYAYQFYKELGISFTPIETPLSTLKLKISVIEEGTTQDAE